MTRAPCRCYLALLIAALGLGALVPGQAAATFHGRNGTLAWSSVVSDGKAGGAFSITLLPPGRAKRHVIASCSDVDSLGNPIYCQSWDRVSYSPDGKRLVWDMLAPAGNYVIVLAHSDGSHQAVIIDHGPSGSDFQPSFSPDGTRIVYVRGAIGSEGQIVSSDLSGGSVQPVSATITGYSPVWSPNGRTILFGHNQDIWSIGAGGTNAHRLIRGGQDADFAPNGRQIVYLNNGGFVSTFGTIYTARADGTHRHKLPTIGKCCKFVQSVVFSPNGKRLAFGTLSESAREDLDLSTVSIAGGRPKLIASRFTDFNGGFTNSVSWQALP